MGDPIGSFEHPRGTLQLEGKDSKAPVGSVVALKAGGIGAHRVRLDSPEGYTFLLESESYSVVLNDLQICDGETFVGDLALRRGEWRGRMTCIPPQCRTWGWHQPAAGRYSFVALYIDPKLVEEDLARLRRLQEPCLALSDSALRGTLRKIDVCLQSASPDPTYLECLYVVAALELSCIQGAPPDSQPQGSISASLMKQITEYICENLHQDISLGALAAFAGLSRFHFIRAFKKVVRQTPYQYVLRCRIDKAQEYLRRDDMCIAEIAGAVGFKSAPHFTEAFRRATNRTPSEFRAIHLS